MATNKPLTDEQKAMHRLRMAKYREANRDRVNANNRASQRRTTEKRAAYRKEWKKRSAAIIRSCDLKYRSKYPHKVQAGRKLNQAVKMGRIARPKHCSLCGIEGRIQAHHHDYSKPLEVMWLCHKCHMLQHKSEALS